MRHRPKICNVLRATNLLSSHWMAVIRRSFNCIDFKCFNLLYESLVRPHLEYGVIAWLSCIKWKILKLLKKCRKESPNKSNNWNIYATMNDLKDSIYQHFVIGDIVVTWSKSSKFYMRKSVKAYWNFHLSWPQEDTHWSFMQNCQGLRLEEIALL